MTGTVYTLISDETPCEVYVGATIRPLSKRINGHIASMNNTNEKKNVWLRSLKARPVISEVEVIEYEDKLKLLKELSTLETFYISLFKSWGFKILNTVLNTSCPSKPPHSEETKEKLRKPKPAGFGEKLSASMKSMGFKHSDETRDKISKAVLAANSVELDMLRSCRKGKLRPADVFEIRSLIKSGMKRKEIAAKYNVTSYNIASIACGNSWAWLKEGMQISL